MFRVTFKAIVSARFNAAVSGTTTETVISRLKFKVFRIVTPDSRHYEKKKIPRSNGVLSSIAFYYSESEMFALAKLTFKTLKCRTF